MKKTILTFVLLCVTGAFLASAQFVGVSDVLITPRSPLHVHLNNTTGSTLQLTNTTSGNASNVVGFGINASTSDWIMQNYQNGSLAFWTNGAQRLQISNTGTVLVNNLASGIAGAIVRSNAAGTLSITNFTGVGTDVLLGSGAFGTAVTSGTAWQLIGNIGINPATNWIGTNDAQPFVTRTNNVERIRVLSGGNILFNRTTALFATDLFEAHGNATFPDAINGFTDQAAGNGVFAQNSAAGGIAMVGINSVAAGAGTGAGILGGSNQTGGFGVAGCMGGLTNFTNCGVSGYAMNTVAAGIGVIGGCDNATGVGVQGQSNGATGIGVLGITATASADGMVAMNAAANGAGVGDALYATSNQTGGSTIISVMQSASYYGNAAVSGVAGSAASYGVVGASSSATGTGVRGNNIAAAGASAGFGGYFTSLQTGGCGAAGSVGTSSNFSGTGVSGIAVSTLAAGVGVLGGCDNATGVGVQGQSIGATSSGVLGLTNQQNADGVNGQNLHVSGTGVIGSGNNSIPNVLIGGSGGAFTGTVIGVYGMATTNANGSFGGYFNSGMANSWAYVGGRTGGTAYKINGPGAVATVVNRPDGSQANMFCPEAPEILFQDYGSGQLVNGKASIQLDEIFSNNIHVDQDHPLRVFIQLEGNCNGVYVTNKTANGFEVIELMNGSSNVPFTWTVSAVREDTQDDNGNLLSKHVGVRFPDSPLPIESIGKQKATLKVATTISENEVQVKKTSQITSDPQSTVINKK